MSESKRFLLKCFVGMVSLLIFLTSPSSAFVIYYTGPNHSEVHRKDKLPSTTKPISHDKKTRLSESYGQLTMYFIENQGQLDKRVKFYERGCGHTMFCTDDGIYLCLHQKKRPSPEPSLIRLAPVGMEKGVKLIANDPQEGKANYLVGNDPDKWKTNIPTYGSVVYRDVYPEIDMKFYGNNRRLEYDIVIKRGGNPSRVKFQCSGIESLEITEQGDLSMQLKDGGILVQRKPIVYQEIDGKRVEVNGRFNIQKEGLQFVYGFEVASYDKEHVLIIDPVLNYSTYLGGSSWDMANAIAVDGSGNAYVAGWTESFDFPLQNPFQKAYTGDEYVYLTDVFITKINTSGNALVYSTFLGGNIYRQGNAADFAKQIAVDGSGNAYVTGYTNSADFPTKNPIQRSLAGGFDVFVTKINASGKALAYSTYLGGDSDDYGHSVALDGSGNTYVTGWTESTDFPTKNPLQRRKYEIYDVFVTKINASGKALAYSTYLGGNSADYGHSIAVDRSGNAYVTGDTRSTDFPVKNHLQERNAGGFDVFVTKINASGKALVYSTYLGGNSADYGRGIAVDGSGNTYVTGWTESFNFPTRKGFEGSKSKSCDAFVTKIVE